MRRMSGVIWATAIAVMFGVGVAAHTGSSGSGGGASGCTAANQGVAGFVCPVPLASAGDVAGGFAVGVPTSAGVLPILTDCSGVPAACPTGVTWSAGGGFAVAGSCASPVTIANLEFSSTHGFSITAHNGFHDAAHPCVSMTNVRVDGGLAVAVSSCSIAPTGFCGPLVASHIEVNAAPTVQPLNGPNIFLDHSWIHGAVGYSGPQAWDDWETSAFYLNSCALADCSLGNNIHTSANELNLGYTEQGLTFKNDVWYCGFDTNGDGAGNQWPKNGGCTSAVSLFNDIGYAIDDPAATISGGTTLTLTFTRNDAASGTNGSGTFTDASITQLDLGRMVTCTGCPAADSGNLITSVNPGVSFTYSGAYTGTTGPIAGGITLTPALCNGSCSGNGYLGSTVVCGTNVPTFATLSAITNDTTATISAASTNGAGQHCRIHDTNDYDFENNLLLGSDIHPGVTYCSTWGLALVQGRHEVLNAIVRNNTWAKSAAADTGCFEPIANGSAVKGQNGWTVANANPLNDCWKNNLYSDGAYVSQPEEPIANGGSGTVTC